MSDTSVPGRRTHRRTRHRRRAENCTHRAGPETGRSTGIAKARLVECLIEVGAVSHISVHYPTGRKKTELRRRRTHRSNYNHVMRGL